MIHVFIGTKAQYIKTAPLLRLMDAQIVPYRLIDSGQHASLSTSMRQDLGVREPDYLLGGDRDVTSIPQAIVWMLSLAKRLISARRLRSEVFGGESGVCVVHGDTPSTLLATLMAKHAGMAVAHLEAGLRSRNVFHPFPEELVRMIVMRRADVLFAPDDDAIANLDAMNVRGRIVRLDGNTSLEAVRHVAPTLGSDGPVVVTMHRVENLHRATRRRGFVALVRRVAQTHDVHFVVHEPTRAALGTDLDSLAAAGVRITDLTSHREFVQALARAQFVVTDGGSIQEECALLGVPTLLWRDRTERPDGLDRNVVLGHYQATAVDSFLADPQSYRREPSKPDERPSEQILTELSGYR